jgi:hypothetical protein
MFSTTCLFIIKYALNYINSLRLKVKEMNKEIISGNDSRKYNDFMHGSMTTCRACHAPTGGSHPGYHQNGTVGPLGLVEKILRKNHAP